MPYESYELPYEPEKPVIDVGISVTLNNAVVGLRVKRGKDWVYGLQDHWQGKPQSGTVTTISNIGTVRAVWDGSNHYDYYHIGYKDRFDLYIDFS